MTGWKGQDIPPDRPAVPQGIDLTHRYFATMSADIYISLTINNIHIPVRGFPENFPIRIKSDTVSSGETVSVRWDGYSWESMKYVERRIYN